MGGGRGGLYLLEVMVQSAITISLNLGCDLVEVNHIEIDAIGVLYAEVIELVLSIGNRVMETMVWSSMMNSLLILGVCAPLIVLFDAF